LFTSGAVVLILLGVAHSLSLFEKMTPTNEAERQLLDLMSNYRFNLVGSMRSMDNLLRGFSICFIVGVIGLGVLDLALSRERPGLVKRVALINALWLAVLTAVALRFFFLVPTTFIVVAFLLFVLAWIALPKSVS
jgi:hypothetical protein